jgi:GT2 family glycosyltransferase
MDEIAILILFFNKVDQTIECVNSFLPSNQNIYVLNNGSAIEQKKKFLKYFEGNKLVHVLNLNESVGPSGGRNYLINNTIQPWLFFVDNDITITPTENWINLINNYLQINPSAEIICPAIYNVHETEYMGRLSLKISNKNLELIPEMNYLTNYFPEGGSLVRRSVFEKFGLYDEIMYSLEGYEFALRALMSDKGQIGRAHV